MACRSGKISYRNSNRAAKVVGERYVKDGIILDTYKCDLCFQWHLTRRLLRPREREDS